MEVVALVGAEPCQLSRTEPPRAHIWPHSKSKLGLGQVGSQACPVGVAARCQAAERAASLMAWHGLQEGLEAQP